MSKLKRTILIFGIVFLSLTIISGIVFAFLKPEKAKDGVLLNEHLENATGTYITTIKGDNTIEIAEKGNTLLGTENVESITIIGMDGATIRAKGKGAGRIQTNGNGTLIIKNVTIIDETPHTGKYYWDYLSFGGKLVFENCEFRQSIKILGESATFENCTFHSPWKKYYSVWLGNGQATFDNCTFTGYRALKLHEYEKYEQDISSVNINGCTFKNIVEKPGIVMGDFPVNPKETTISVKNSTFLNNYAWDGVDCAEGIHGFYESDNPTSEFVFVNENNVVDYTANVYNIYYRAVVNGEVVKVSSAMWKKDGNYPTYYKSGSDTSKINDLTLRISMADGDKSFFGWYLDEECTQKFDGVLDETQTGDIVLYGWYIDLDENELPPVMWDDDLWTKNY